MLTKKALEWYSYMRSLFVLMFSDVHGLASGQKPSQAKPKVLAWSWLWLDLDFLKAKANGPDHGFENYF
jgi:hypothetical protein